MKYMTNKSNDGTNANGMYANCKLRSGLANITVLITGITSQKRTVHKLTCSADITLINILFKICDRAAKPMANVTNSIMKDRRAVKTPSLINS
jgi:hypothetical protein